MPNDDLDIVLLGAGASAKAGVPMAFGMTDAVVKSLSSEFGDILAYVIGALQFQKGIAGTIPLGDEHCIDIESLANALDLLSARGTLEIAPFVTSWHPRLSQVEGDVQYHQSLGLIGSRLNALRFRLPLEVLKLTDAPDIGAGAYFEPLLRYKQAREDRFTIATLNYDRVLELEAAARGIALDTGLTTWISKGPSGPEGKGLFLLKLHGSTDWWYDLDGNVVSPRPAPKDNGPAILFGGLNKLTAKGPFLDLFMAFRQELQRAKRLTVIGYSFRDEHINETILRWFKSSPSKRLRIINPSLPFDALRPYMVIPLPLDDDTHSLFPGVEPIPRKAEEALAEFPE